MLPVFISVYAMYKKFLIFIYFPLFANIALRQIDWKFPVEKWKLAKIEWI